MRLQAPKKGSKIHHQKRTMCTHALFAKNLLLLQLLPEMSTTDACVGDNFACRMDLFGRRGRQPTFRTHVLLVEPASRAPKNLDESKANTNNPMVACASERNGVQSNNKRSIPAFLSASALSMKAFCCCCCRGKSYRCCCCYCRGSSNLLVLHLLLLAVKNLYFCCLRLPPSFRVENPILPAAADSCCCLTAAAGVAAVVASFQIVGRKCPPCVCWGRRT